MPGSGGRAGPGGDPESASETATGDQAPPPATRSDPEPAATGGDPRSVLLSAAIAHVAEHGFGGASLRQIAAAIGSSHRMLIYHFGSKRGLAAAIIDAIQQAQLATLTELLSIHDLPPAEAAQRFWRLVTDNAMRFGPLFFELAADAMRHPGSQPMAVLAVHMWLEPLAGLWRAGGASDEQAPVLARMSLALANGLLLDALLTGDRAATQTAMEAFSRQWIDALQG
jgi:AcrR family transcriptional regulator